MAPVPYEIIGRFSDGIMFSDSVCMTGLNVMTTASRLPKVYGDEAGTGGGVTSGVNVGYCKPITHTPTVRAQGDFIVFHSAEYWMNCSGPDGPGNTKGTVTFVENVDAVYIGPLGDIEGETNPPAKAETKEEKSWWETGLDWTHTALDVVGLIPVLGEVADGANAVIHGVEAGIYAASGNNAKAAENAAMAALSAAAMWPLGGQAATGAKFAIKAGKELLEEGAEKVVKEGIEEGIEQGAKKEVKEEVGEQATKNGVKISTDGQKRLPQDTKVDPTAPEPLPLDRKIGTNKAQDKQLREDIDDAIANDATDIRVNQQQVDANGNRVGVNRPDLQYTTKDGKRVYVEYDQKPSSGISHKERIDANDSNGEVILKTIK